MKKCSICGEEKSLDNFYKKAGLKDGRYKSCNICTRKIVNEKRNKNKDLYNERSRKYRKNNPEKYRKTNEKYIKNNLEKVREKAKQHRQTELFKKNRRTYLKNKRDSDICYKLATLLRGRIYDVVKKNSKSLKTLELLGCSKEELKLHIEKQFKPGMNWENHGLYGWHIDHIRPCASFDLTDIEQQKECFHYTNLQPLWAIENISKHSKWPYFK